uniref:Uncharacterized protein n=1 Tax=Chromera velia CCMP2878 TaxID=1169474 RepID=A0A0G4FKX5_9ALVE|mmetsp:Transcript_31970/g.63378  ORF Transcript_31970/g.63378 Transcript_31970/m.63378 type:complete len:151 (-) Transcript_31970:535-987(-)|eukprot:Cvel_17545.t1-p1 / transcript=Cvel_17545.t1 / gene=Cvel_17545 / organism=Chromera_velia_CCMP2878 / gene_product=hypothetical protein / transcript_product=hypothetical protein / location=Cvel_scaffold1408:31211-33737(-) / protein_length=150 / sequence_SO=supercontig / SO=protein_coding / is_pseudo=false
MLNPIALCALRRSTGGLISLSRYARAFSTSDPNVPKRDWGYWKPVSQTMTEDSVRKDSFYRTTLVIGDIPIYAYGSAKAAVNPPSGYKWNWVRDVMLFLFATSAFAVWESYWETANYYREFGKYYKEGWRHHAISKRQTLREPMGDGIPL